MEKVLHLRFTKLTKQWVAKKLPKRPKDANKGTFGKILVVAGSENFPGAAYLCCAAAHRVGAGLVTLATPPSVKQIVARKLPEVTHLSFEEIFENLEKYDVLLFGSGLGQKLEAQKLIEELVKKELPSIIIDGDGLNLLSKMGKWWERLNREVVLTPHPGEMSRLTGLSIKEIQADRIDIAQYFAKKWDKVVVLKGANTIIASPAGEVLLSPFANPVLATAGTGDVLAGVIAGMLSQDLKLFDASGVGVYIHGLAGEMLRKKIGDAGVLAGDLLPVLPQVLANLHTQTLNR